MVKENSKKLSESRKNTKKQPKNNMILAQNEFSSALFGEFVNGVEENVVISPFSIYIAMMNCMLGTGGETLNEMIDGLFLRDSFDSCKISDSKEEQFQNWKKSELKQYTDMIKSIVQNNSVLSIANRIYVEETLKVKSEFINELVDQFDSTAVSANFSNNAGQEVNNINQFVASSTNNSIKNLISRLDPNTLVVIINAIYFNGKWKQQFYKKSTIQKSFRSVNGKSKCKMMSLQDSKSNFHFAEIDDYQILSLPYTDEEYCMTFIKPDDDSVEINEETEEEFNKWLQSKLTDISQLNTTDSVTMKRIEIPKFKFEKTFSNLIPTMQQEPFQIKSLFNTKKADFSHMLTNTHPGAFVSQIIHKACIEVDESGTVASAATAIVCKERKKSSSSKEEVYEFIADRPFAFVLQHVPTQSVLFVGKINQIE